jgi:predicted nuclease of predicted toxin-antitoxin system
MSQFMQGITNGHLMKDKEITEVAINEDWIVLTKDSDF